MVAAMQTQAARSVMKVPNMTTRLHELRCPVFGFWGVNDQFNPVGGAMKIVENAPQARMVKSDKDGNHGIRGIAFTIFQANDVVRHPLVQSIVTAYEAYHRKIR